MDFIVPPEFKGKTPTQALCVMFKGDASSKYLVRIRITGVGFERRSIGGQSLPIGVLSLVSYEGDRTLGKFYLKV